MKNRIEELETDREAARIACEACPCILWKRPRNKSVEYTRTGFLMLDSTIWLGMGGAPSEMIPIPFGQVPWTNKLWTCPACYGLWFATDQTGKDWMQNKMRGLHANDQYLETFCHKCDGDTWKIEGPAGPIRTYTGIYMSENCPWIFQGLEGLWTTGIPIAQPGDRQEDQEDPGSNSKGDTEPVTDPEDDQEPPNGGGEPSADQPPPPSGGRTYYEMDEANDPGPEASNPTTCTRCGGRWFQTDVLGARWMRKKTHNLKNLELWEYHECDQCEGGIWEGIRHNSHIITSTGVKWDGGKTRGTTWIYKGNDNYWDRSQTDKRRPEEKTPKPRPATRTLEKSYWDRFNLQTPVEVDQIGQPHLGEGTGGCVRSIRGKVPSH